MMALPAFRRGPGEASFTLAVDPGLEAFRGHFPGDPILPGVVLVDWAIRLGTEQFGPLGRFSGLDQVKFLEAIRPGEQVELVLAFDPGKGALRFQYAGSGRKASGVVLFT